MSSETRVTSQPTGTGHEVSATLFTDAEETLISMQEIIGRKWHPVIVYHLLADGPLGFGALKERTEGISSKMLSDSLDDLENAGLLTRTILNDKPVRVEYALTDRGEALEPIISDMLEWGSQHESAFDPSDDEATNEDETNSRPRMEGR